jgi:two-component system sensor histidine kinase CpxA
MGPSMKLPKINILSRLFKRPSSLLTKIFLWFCIYIITVFIAGTWISMTSMDFSSKSSVLKRISNDALFLYGQILVERYEKESKDAVARSLKHIENIGEMRIFLFDSEGKEILGRTPYGNSKAQIQNSLNSKKYSLFDYARLFHHKTSLIKKIAGESGKKYIAVAEPTHNFLGKIFAKYTVSRLVIFLIAAGCFSYLLSRYLTTPIRILKTATQKLAMGDLSTRIGLLKGKRRDELVDLAGDFDRMAEKIEILEDVRRQFLSDISHELRSPLARLNIAVEMARKQNHPDISDHLERIDLESQRLNDIINRLLATTRKKNLVETDDPVSIKLHDLLNEILKDANFEAQSRKCSVKMVSKIDIELIGIRHLIKCAIENVIYNAIRYTKKGTCVEISLRKENKSGSSFAIIVIRDYGNGVPEDSLRKIFQPFYRVDSSRDRQSGGTGLGLAITDRAIRYHHGTVAASNASDGGLIVEMSIPRSGFKT